MTRTRQVASIALLAVLVLVAAQPADALLISQVQPFTANGPVGSIGVTPFDPTLGTLDSVAVNISGVLSVTGTTPANLVPMGLISVPVPYAYGITVTQDYTGLAGKYFDFLDPAQFMFFGTASGNPGTGFAFTTNYSFDFDVTAFSDLIGFVLPTTTSSAGALIPPLSGIDVKRSDFLATALPVDQIDIVQLATPTFSSGPLPVISSVSAGGLLTIDYLYTPVVSVPVPGTLLIVGAALAGLLAARRR